MNILIAAALQQGIHHTAILRFAKVIESLEGGVVMNFGSGFSHGGYRGDPYHSSAEGFRDIEEDPSFDQSY